MEIKFGGRHAQVRVMFDVQDAEPLILADETKFVPRRIRITYRDNDTARWMLEGRKLRKDGAPYLKDATVLKDDLLYVPAEGGYQVPSWITDLVTEHAPKTMDI
ncbi:hypothetical protein [Nonomuraea sp. NPDC050786]|uniref:hypothetical protein n=1 Tax=Nonomuraea sp. NPDC050786 TaxID=3154840 RepID=UPI0033E8A824